MEDFEKPFHEAKEWLKTKSKFDDKVSLKDALAAIDLAQMKYDLYHEQESGFLEQDTEEAMKDDIDELMKS